jgi:hypothetical protein
LLAFIPSLVFQRTDRRGRPDKNMNIAAAGISALIGAAFLVVEIIVPYYPSIFGLGDSLHSVLSAEQSKARAAVSKLLIDPDSAKFDALREVELKRAKYVCGNVDGKDRSGSYVGQRPFVYDVISDFAAIDDDGRIARPHNRFKPCPVLEEAKLAPFVIDLDKANKIQKVLPKADIQIVLSHQSSSDGTGPSVNQSLEQLSSRTDGNLGLQSNAADGSQIESTSPSALADEKEWRSDRPPGAWPRFPLDDPLSKPGTKLINSEAIELASEIESRWKRFETGKSATHPSVSEIEEALRALLAIKEQSSEFPQAWASFVRLRKTHRTARVLAERG